MKVKLKKLWVKALRSGKYKQGQGYLKLAGNYCCLGVLREVMHPKSKLTAEDEEVLHPDHLKESGITERQQRKLVKLNDGDEVDFSKIADYIEKRL